jgi:hypothetical protein
MVSVTVAGPVGSTGAGVAVGVGVGVGRGAGTPPVLGKIAEMPEIAVIQAASLDDSSSHKPTADFFTASAQPWDFMNSELPKFEKEPAQ